MGLRVPSAGVHLFPHLEVEAEVLCQAHLSGGRQGRLPVEVLCPDHLSGGRQGRPSVAGLLALRPLGHRGCHQLAAAERWRRRLQASKALQKQES